MSDDAFIGRLKSLVGPRNVLSSERATERYRKGYRSGEGEALAVVVPQSLVQMWRVVQACVEAEKIIILQAANTGLTEGSTPSGDYDRDVVVISTLALDKIHLLEREQQVVALPGSTLFTLEKLLKPLGRTPHSEIGSSCIGASVIGGVCNNSGGALVKRGPAFTELALYAQRQADGSLVLVNNLGIDLGDTPEEMLDRLENRHFDDADIRSLEKLASDREYAARVRDVDADTPARYNADPRRLHEASGCAGKLAVFAARLDTFQQEGTIDVFYLGTNDTGKLATLRRRLLTEMDELPVLAEYMHRDVFDIAEKYGKDTFLMINWLGTDRLPAMFAMKGRVNAICNRLPLLPHSMTDRVMQLLSRLAPSHLPRRLRDFRNAYEHHLILKVGQAVSPQAQAIFEQLFTGDDAGYFKCTEAEGKKALLHRFGRRRCRGALCDRARPRGRRHPGPGHRASPERLGLVGNPAGGADRPDDRPALLRPFPLPRIPSGLHRPQRRRRENPESQDAGIAGRTRRGVSGGTQCRTPLRGEAGAEGVLRGPGSDKHLQPRHRQDLQAAGLPASGGPPDGTGLRRGTVRLTG